MEQRPIILEIEDAKQELVESINKIIQQRRLNYYLLEPIIAEMYKQIKDAAQRELAQARQIEVNAQVENKDGAE